VDVRRQERTENEKPSEKKVGGAVATS
jgi:hypothetical protein